MIDLPPMPPRIAALRRDTRGFPVPWFVAWIDGAPDFRVIDPDKFNRALRHPCCWVCGGPLGVHRVFVIGPMCGVNRVTSEPPSHRDCAEFAARACPFLTHPRMRRNERDLPVNGVDAAGFHLDRNPGVICLWETPDYRPFRVKQGSEGVLFSIGNPVQVDWWTQGREATREEVLASINSGLPELSRLAQLDGTDGIAELSRAYDRLMPLLPGPARIHA